MSCGVVCRHGSDPALLWLWYRPAAVAPIGPLAREPPYALGMALKSKTNKQSIKQKSTYGDPVNSLPSNLTPKPNSTPVLWPRRYSAHTQPNTHMYSTHTLFSFSLRKWKLTKLPVLYLMFLLNNVSWRLLQICTPKKLFCCCFFCWLFVSVLPIWFAWGRDRWFLVFYWWMLFISMDIPWHI